jgi:hypothetical protein
MILWKFMKIKRNYVFFLLLITICFTEGILNRHLDVMLANCIHGTSLFKMCHYYPHGYQFDNDIDNEIINLEAYGLALNAYDMGSTNEKSPHFRMNMHYPADEVRILFPFLSSFFLRYLTLKNSYLLINIIMWILASGSIGWLGNRIYKSWKIGVIAGLLCSTSYALIVLSSSTKSEIFQITFYICLVALSFHLDHFSNTISRRDLGNSFLLGVFGGLGIFASGATVYFLAFMTSYSLSTMKISAFSKRTLSFLIGLLLVYLMFNFSLYKSTFPFPSHYLSLATWWGCFKDKMIHHFFFTVPLHFWIGAFGGLLLLNRDQLNLIFCMFTTFIVSEAIMYVVQGSSCWNWTLSHYYLQILLPIYLINARFLYYLFFESGNKRSVIVLAKRVACIVYILLTLFTSNLGLLGNKYFYYIAFRPTSIQILYHSFFTYDNLHIYKEFSKNIQ